MIHELVNMVPADYVRTRRHLAGCAYLPGVEWRQATAEEMRTLVACQECARRADREGQ